MADQTPSQKDIRNKLLVEAMHRCCLCPEHRDVTDLHHVVPIRRGGPNTEKNLFLAWAEWHQLKGDTVEARATAQEALAIADRCEYRLKQADIHNFLARLDLEAGDRTSASRHARTACERAWCDGPPHCYKPALDEAQRLLDQLGVAPHGRTSV
jgi:hypothetical protein